MIKFLSEEEREIQQRAVLQSCDRYLKGACNCKSTDMLSQCEVDALLGGVTGETSDDNSPLINTAQPTVDGVFETASCKHHWVDDGDNLQIVCTNCGERSVVEFDVTVDDAFDAEELAALNQVVVGDFDPDYLNNK